MKIRCAEMCASSAMDKTCSVAKRISLETDVPISKLVIEGTECPLCREVPYKDGVKIYDAGMVFIGKKGVKYETSTE